MGSVRRTATVVVLAGMLAVTGCGGDDEDGGSSASGEGADRSYPTQEMSACEVLTAEVARAAIGKLAPENSPAPEAGSDEVTVSSCTRVNKADDVRDSRSASLLMRVAESDQGARSNEVVFDSSSLPQGAEEVSGYGEQAFWNPEFGQLNILEGGNWYILSVGPLDPEKHTLAETEKLADAIIDDL